MAFAGLTSVTGKTVMSGDCMAAEDSAVHVSATSASVSLTALERAGPARGSHRGTVMDVRDGYDDRNHTESTREARPSRAERERLSAATSRRLDRRIKQRLNEAQAEARAKEPGAWSTSAGVSAPADRLRWDLTHTRATREITGYDQLGAESRWVRLTPSQNILLAQLVDLECKPAPVSWLAARAALSERQVRRIIAQLRALCLDDERTLIRTERGKRGKGYRLCRSA